MSYRISKKSVLLYALCTMLFACLLHAQEARLFVEFDVHDYSEGVASDYAVAKEFIDAMDFSGLGKLELPDSGCIDPNILKKFLPPPIRGTRASIYTFDDEGHEATGPTTYQSPAMGRYAYSYAFVQYVREAEDQNYWEEIRIYIRDMGVAGETSMRRFHTDEDNKKFVEFTTIQGCKATVFRATETRFENYGAVQISIPIPLSGLYWPEILEAAKQGVRQGVQVWKCGATFKNGTINGPELVIPPGSLEGPCFSENIIDEIMVLDIPIQIPLAFANAVWSGWNHWSLTFSVNYPNAFPAFASYPGASAPPTPANPMPVLLASFNREKLTTGHLKSYIMDHLEEWKDDPEAQKAVADFAQWFDECFTNAINKSHITNLMGRGPVPSYNPPIVPNGPVVNGEVVATPVIFTGFEF
jgi:hypothetical protein